MAYTDEEMDARFVDLLNYVAGKGMEVTSPSAILHILEDLGLITMDTALIDQFINAPAGSLEATIDAALGL